jgi:Zn-dependent M28 family amino/carboxypeptidase
MFRTVVCLIALIPAGCAMLAVDPAAGITAEALAGHIRILSADEFGGRAPASPGEELTIDYLQKRFAALGVLPGNGASYFQDVPLVQIDSKAESALAFRARQGGLDLEVGRDAVAWTKRQVDGISLDGSEVVFAGYGIVAPEYGWDDYAGLDVRGKTVFVLVNDPGFATGNPELFNGTRMTYYGRWTYKYEEAARQGAAAAIIIHETAAAGYPWEVVTGSWSGAQFDLQSDDGNAGRVQVEGWITSDAAQSLFALAGADLDNLRKRAARPGFRPVPLPVRASLRLRNEFENTVSRNVVALVPGRTRADEYIIYMAHWDHLGTDPELEGDQIYNGARDNASGLAALLELARAFRAMQPPPERSVVFLAVTAEESGLLGSRWYTENPIYPLARTVAGINMDSLNVMGPTRDVTVVGDRSSELEEYLAAAAAEQGRVLVPEDSPEKGYFYRSDQFNFAKQGVPVLYADGGIDHIVHGSDWGRAWEAEYTATRYHKPADEYSEDWDLSGAAADIRLLFRVGERLSRSSDWPNWYPGNEFRAIRDASRRALTGN